jgi:FMN-dependent NADH-azoreductase
MSRLLYIQSAPRGERSVSIAVADAFVNSYRNARPADEVTVMNLIKKELPPLDGYLTLIARELNMATQVKAQAERGARR